MNEKKENKEKNAYLILAKKRDSMMRGNQKRNRKAGSVHQATKKEDKKINININQNININTNQKELEKKSRYTYTLNKKKTVDFKKKRNEDEKLHFDTRKR